MPMLCLKYSVDLLFMAVVCLPNRSWICVYFSVRVCAFSPKFPAAASVCVWPHLIYMLRLTLTDYLFRVFASKDWGVDSSLPQRILLRYMCTFTHTHTHSHTLTQPSLPTASPFGQGLCSVMQVRSLCRGSPGGKPERKERMEWVK